MATFQAGTLEILSEARRLGLVWGLRPATVLNQNNVQYDGDDSETVTRVVNLLESPLFATQRVMCIFVPPAGNFVIGSLTDTRVLFRALRAATQSIPTASETEIEWDSVDVDTHGGWNSDFPTDWIAPFDGWYDISGGCGWNGGGVSRRGVFFRVNHVSVDGAGALFTGGSAGSNSIPGRPVTLSLNAGDSIQLAAYQDSGGPINTLGTGSQCPSIAISYNRPPIMTS